MSFRKKKPIHPAPPTSVAADIAWEYDDETAAYRRPASRPTPMPPTSDARTQRVQRALDVALDGGAAACYQQMSFCAMGCWCWKPVTIWTKASVRCCCALHWRDDVAC
jgi:hypothetical protein